MRSALAPTKMMTIMMMIMLMMTLARTRRRIMILVTWITLEMLVLPSSS